MAWGYEKCFTIEHDNTLKRRIDCKDCIYYDSSDKSCMKRPLYLPEDGYNSWKNCKYFELDQNTSHYYEKNAQYTRELVKKTKKQQHQKTSVARPKINQQYNSGIYNVSHNKEKSQIKKLQNGYLFCVVETIPEGKKLRTEAVALTKKGDWKNTILIKRDIKEKKIYINSIIYTRNITDKVYQRLNEKS